MNHIIGILPLELKTLTINTKVNSDRGKKLNIFYLFYVRW